MIALAACAGACIDQVAGEPPVPMHPVVWFAALMNAAERRTYADRRINGVAFVAVGSGAAIVTGLTLRKLVGPRAATALAVAVCAAGKMLDSEALAVADMLRRGDLEAARVRVRSLVGRDASELDESEISRAVIESVAENSVDACHVFTRVGVDLRCSGRSCSSSDQHSRCHGRPSHAEV